MDEGGRLLKRQPNILLGHDLEAGQLAQIQKTVPGAALRHVRRDSLSQDDFAWADIFFGWPPRKLLKYGQHLEWVHLPSAGADAYVDPDMYAREILLTNSSGVFGIPLAEHVLGMMLAFSRNLHHYGRLQTAKRWEVTPGSQELYGKVLGILGLGDIGKEVAKRASAFGMQIWALKRRMDRKPDYVHHLVDSSGLDDLLQASDYVVVALPLTSKTRGLLGSRELALIKPHGILINVGRGPIVDEKALSTALQKGAIAGAGLDVFEKEPLPEDSPLWEMPNVIITPHCAGITPYVTQRIVNIFCHNLRLWQEGKGNEMMNIVDKALGY